MNGGPFAEVAPLRGGRYEFNPATLIVRRPERTRSDPVLDGALALNHERTHWYQFCGSTVGAALMTLRRLEELLLLAGMQSERLLSEDRRYLTGRMRAGLSLLGGGSPATLDEIWEAPSWTRSVIYSFAQARTARTLLLDSTNQWTWPGGDRGRLFLEMISRIEETYAFHTGGRRPWPADLLADVCGRMSLVAEPVMADGTELTTRHVLEGAAFLNEWSAIMASAWGGLLRPGAAFRQMPTALWYLVRDGIEASSDRYLLCTRLALERWRSLLPGTSESDLANQLARLMPMLACCFDVAINPPLPPICRPVVLSWNELYPPARFVAAVDAVRSVGLLETWPDEAVYHRYRTALCDACGLQVGEIDDRSFQNPGLTAEFFCTATGSEPLLNKMSYFDYVIWCMESLHLFRRSHPLLSSLPWLTFTNFDGFNHLMHAASRESVFAAAPLYWTGDEYGREQRLSEAFALKLVLESCSLWCLRQAMTTPGIIDVSEAFPAELLREEGFRDLVMRAIGQVEAFTSRQFSFDTGPQVDDAMTEAKRTRRAGPPRVAGTRSHMYRVSREEVETCDVTRLVTFLGELRADPALNVRSVDVRFDSYSVKEEGLWDIAEVRRYLRELQDVCPFWPWYFDIHPDPSKCAGFTLMFLASMSTPRRITLEELEPWFLRTTSALYAEAELGGIDKAQADLMTSDVGDTLTHLSQDRLE